MPLGYVTIPESPNAAVEAAKELPEEGEPENALTRKFTPADWKAVKELRVRPSTELPSVLHCSSETYYRPLVDSFSPRIITGRAPRHLRQGLSRLKD